MEFQKRKVTKEILEEMKKLRENNSYKKIAEHFNIHISTVMYHLNEKTRNKIKERRRNYQIKDLEGYRKYQRQYQNYRYSNDKEFREKKRKESFDYYQKNKKKKEVKNGRKNKTSNESIL